MATSYIQKENLASTTVSWDTTYCNVSANTVYKYGKVVSFEVPNALAGFPTETMITIGTLPSGYRPAKTITHRIYSTNSSLWWYLEVNTSGEVILYLYGNTSPTIIENVKTDIIFLAA